MLMTDWRMIRKNPALIQRFHHHSHEAKPFDAALCIISFARRKMMCSTGLQSFVMWALVGNNICLHQNLSRKVCHRRTLMHLEIEPMGFDLLEILKAFYMIHPDRFLTDESDIGRIAWTLYFGRRLNGTVIPINPDFAKVFAEYGDLNGDDMSSLVLAMIDCSQSLQIFTELSDKPLGKSYYWYIALADAIDNNICVPRDLEIFKILRELYWDFKQVSSNQRERYLRFPDDTLWWASSVCIDAIYALSRITQKRVPGLNSEFNPKMAKSLLQIGINLVCPKSLKFITELGQNSFRNGTAKNSLDLTIFSPGNQVFELSKYVEGQKVVLTCSRQKDFHSLFSSVWTILFISNYCFLSQAVTEIKFWKIKKTSCGKGDDYQIILLATLDLSKFVGPNVKIDLIRLFRTHIFLWVNSGSELIVIRYSVSENGVFLGKRFSFPLTYLYQIDKGDDSESFFKITCTKISPRYTIVTYSRILNCAGEKPLLVEDAR